MPFDHVGIPDLPELIEDTRDTGRTYLTPDGNRYPSITTVLKILSKDGIAEWRERIGEEEAQRILTQAGTRGTAVHDLAEKYLNNDPDWKKGAMPINLFTFNPLKHLLDAKVNNIRAQEVPLYSDRFRIAGRVDCVADWEGELSIIDFKTARKPKKEEWVEAYKIQVAFYAAAFYERTGVPIRKGVILISPDGGTPQVFEVKTFDYLHNLKSLRAAYFHSNGI